MLLWQGTTGPIDTTARSVGRTNSVASLCLNKVEYPCRYKASVLKQTCKHAVAPPSLISPSTKSSWCAPAHSCSTSVIYQRQLQCFPVYVWMFLTFCRPHQSTYSSQRRRFNSFVHRSVFQVFIKNTKFMWPRQLLYDISVWLKQLPTPPTEGVCLNLPFLTLKFSCKLIRPYNCNSTIFI